MKTILIPIRLFEAGDRVYSPEGLATVVSDDMKDFQEKFASALSCLGSPSTGKAIEYTRNKEVVLRLDYASSTHTNVDVLYVSDRDLLIPLKKYKIRPNVCPRCGGDYFEDESTAHFAQRFYQCGSGSGHSGCGEMFLVDPNTGE